MSEREELRRKLRAKIRGARGGGEGPQLASRLGSDPQGALLSMGVDDPSLLQAATDLLKSGDARALASNLKGSLRHEGGRRGNERKVGSEGKGEKDDGGRGEEDDRNREGREERTVPEERWGEEEEEAPPPA